MRPVRDVWGQLVEQRLWPVALVLVAALVAVPLLLAKPATDDDAAGAEAPVAAATAAADLRTPGEPVVSVAEVIEGAPLRGHVKNPFRQQHVPAQASEAGGSAPVGQPPAGGGADSGASTGGGSGGSGGSSGGGSGGGGSGDGDGGATEDTFTYASIDVSFGRAGSPLREIRDVPRLTALPNAGNPIVIFLGMRGDHETAVFLLSTDVHAQGDGRCTPSVKLCEAIELRQDDVAFLDVRADDGTVTQYELDLVAVELHETTSQRRATQSEARTSRAGGLYLERVRRPRRASGATPRASAGTAPRAPVLTPLP